MVNEIIEVQPEKHWLMYVQQNLVNSRPINTARIHHARRKTVKQLVLHKVVFLRYLKASTCCQNLRLTVMGWNKSNASFTQNYFNYIDWTSVTGNRGYTKITSAILGNKQYLPCWNDTTTGSEWQGVHCKVFTCRADLLQIIPCAKHKPLPVCLQITD
jgi:hypothetical protein